MLAYECLLQLIRHNVQTSIPGCSRKRLSRQKRHMKRQTHSVTRGLDHGQTQRKVAM